MNQRNMPQVIESQMQKQPFLTGSLTRGVQKCHKASQRPLHLLLMQYLTPLKLDALTKLDITCMQKEHGCHLKSEGDTRDGKKGVELTNLVIGEIEPDDS